MLSSKHNIDTIVELIAELRHYIGLQKDYLKLDAVDKAIVLLSALIVAMIVALIASGAIIFLSFTAVYALSAYIGLAWAYCVITLFYLFLLVLVIAFRKSWIVRPLTRLLANVLINKDDEE